jgi:hypothetical protein
LEYHTAKYEKYSLNVIAGIPALNRHPRFACAEIASLSLAMTVLFIGAGCNFPSISPK